jgi:hypothetical protein
MLNQSQLITQAVEILNDTTGPPQERLVKGFKVFYRATIMSEDWPAHLWDKYNAICELALAGGTVQKTADRMDLKSAGEYTQRVAREMAGLAAALDLARAQRLIPPPVVSLLRASDHSWAGPAEIAGTCG